MAQSESRDQLIEQFIDVTKAMMKAWKAQFFAAVDDPNLSPAQIGIMVLVHRRAACSGRDLASELHISRSAVTQMLEGLIEQGYISRQEDPNDRRISNLELTTTGGRKMRELDKIRKRLFDKLTDDLTDQELLSITIINQKITEALNK